MTRLTLTTALCLLPAFGIAQSQVERMEEMSENMNAMMVDMMVAEIEAAGGDATALREAEINMPDWDDEMRSAASCVIDRYNDIAGEDAVNETFDRIDALMAEMDGQTLEAFAEDETMETMLPDGISIEASGQISQECGMMALQMRDMQASGLMQAMMEAGSTVPDND
ncbi:MAG: hypothetical protein AAFU41_15190 [Pseudomonadota bacterium]